MNEKTRRAIETHIERIIKEFRFENQRADNLEKCPCYAQNKPCHNIPLEEFNCLLCFCPEYNTSNSEGGCKIPEKGKGEWFYHPSHQTGRIWDCSNCGYPNREEIVREYLKAIFSLNE